jgi:hypothetical protein
MCSTYASCCHLSIPTSFSYFHNPFQQSHFKNTNAQYLDKYFCHCGIPPKNHLINFNCMKIYLHGFVVPTLVYKISINILNLFIVTNFQQTFHNPKIQMEDYLNIFESLKLIFTLNCKYFFHHI